MVMNLPLMNVSTSACTPRFNGSVHRRNGSKYTAAGAANPRMLAARIPNNAKPRRMSRSSIRSSGATGAMAAGGATPGSGGRSAPSCSIIVKCKP